MTNDTINATISKPADLAEGFRLHQSGDVHGAERVYRALIAEGSREDSVYGNLAVICMHSGRREEARKLLQRARELNENNPQHHLNEGVINKEEGKIAEAVECYERALAVRPDYAEPHNNKGLALLDLGRLAESIACFQRALELRCDYPEAQFNLANAYFSAGATVEAVAAFRKAIEMRPEYPQAYLNLGVLLAGSNPEEAANQYRKALEYRPDYQEAHYNLGNALKGLNQLADSERAYKEAVRLRPSHPDAHYNLGNVLHMQLKFEEAIECYQKVIELMPNCDQAYNDMGVAFHSLGKKEKALACYEKSLEINPQSAKTYLNMGVLNVTKNPEDAIATYRKALEISPNYAEVYNNISVAYQAMNKWRESIDAVKKALEIRPTYAEAHYNMGVALQGLGQLDDAITQYKEALQLRPEYPQAYINLGVATAGTMFMSSQKEKLEAAVAYYRKALEINPKYAEAYNNLGVSLQDLEELDEAVECYRKAIELNPAYADSHNNLGNALREHDQLDEAIASYHRALDVKASTGETSEFLKKIGDYLIELERLPIVYEDEQEIAKYREGFTRSLNGAISLIADESHTFRQSDSNFLKRIMFRLTNFYLAYQQYNDKELQVKFAELSAKILEPDLGKYMTLDTVPRNDGKIRVGIASEFLRYHNGSFWAYDWFRHLPKSDYEFYLYSLNGTTDDMTMKFSSLGTYRWLPFRDTDFNGSLETIRKDNLDVLLIPDVGMSGSSKVISLVRMAPIQCVGWGHPMTTGSSNIDFYLSSEFMEPENGDEHYSEKLIRLPNIGLYFDHPVASEPATRKDFDIPESKIAYGSVQSLFKYLPQYDRVFTEIAKRVPKAFFVFGGNKSGIVTEKFKARLKRAFETEGLDFEKHVLVIPRLPLPKFVQLLGLLDVNLDSIGWSGGVTTIRSIGQNLPVITIAGEFMRGRHTSAMMKMIGFEDLVASSVDEYIELACKMGNDKKFRAQMVKKLTDNKEKLFYDTKCAERLDQLFKEELAKRGRW